ncbi:MAG: S24 family peptidase [Clostridia bacterium]
MKWIKAILKGIIYTILGIMIMLCVYILVTTGIFKQDYANVFGYTYFQVKTGSMTGEIEKDDLIIVKLTNKVVENDIITFKDNKDFITHRLIKINNNQLLTKGDANNTLDEPINKTQVIGKVVFVVSTVFMLRALGLLIIIFIILSLINFDVIFKKFIIKSERSKKRNYNLDLEKTIKIPLEEIMKLQNEGVKKEEIEELDFPSLIDDFIDISVVNDDNNEENKFLDQVLKLLKVKNNYNKNMKLNNEWALKLSYVYKLTKILLIDDSKELTNTISSVSFLELYDYEFEEAGLSKLIQNKLYDMPIYIFLKILLFAIIFSDEEFFDAVFKILKYKIKVDKQYLFTSLSKFNRVTRIKTVDELNYLLEFMMKISTNFDCEKYLGLNKITEFVELNKYLNRK